MSLESVEGIKHLKTPLDWGKEACQALMDSYTPPELPPANRWHYHQGVYLYGMLKLWEKVGGDEYFQYIKGYVDHLVDEHGNFIFERKELDSIQAGLLLFTLDQKTEDTRYRKAAQKLRNLFSTLNQTSEGGYWHKDKYPYQMWLDGLYMGGVFAMLYGKHYDEPKLYGMVLEQERLMRKHTKDERTGLYHHAWDESRNTPWSDNETGKAPEFWGRAIGWYGMALVNFLDILPLEDPGRNVLIQAIQELAAAYVKYQDPDTQLWFQVVDKGDQPDNWIETSCSCLFILTLAKAVNKGYIDSSYKEAAIKGFKGLLDRMYFDDKGLLTMPGICIGTSVGTYDYYINRETCENDLHGIGAFILACVEMQSILEEV
jgi:unsaturated rhamnogalacturonyl hydrolase